MARLSAISSLACPNGTTVRCSTALPANGVPLLYPCTSPTVRRFAAIKAHGHLQYTPHQLHALLHHLATLSAPSLHQEPLPEARESRFTMKLRKPEVDDDHGHVSMVFSLLSLALH